MPSDGLDFFAAAPPLVEPSNSEPEAPTRFVPPPPSALLRPPATKGSRWAKSDTTFGPTGRMLATVGMLIPLTFFVATGLLTVDPFVLVGAVIWGALTLKAMQQIWQPVHHHHRR